MIIDHLVNSNFFNNWAYLIIFFSTVLEVSPIIGFFIPGQTIVLIGGFFAKLGILDIGDVIWISALGAFLGDMMSYFLGRKYGYSLISKYGKYFLFKKDHFKKTRNLINKHTGKTLIIGRYNPFTRSLAPFFAGASKVRFLKVLIFCIIGSTTWAACFTILGYIFGASYEIASKYFDIATLTMFVIIIVSIILYKILYKNRRKLV